LMDRLGMEEGQAIEHQLLTGAIRRAQKRVEGRNFEIRKRLLEYDLVLAKQREAIYSLRDRFLLPPRDKIDSVSMDGLDEYLRDLLKEYAEGLIADYANPSQPKEEWDLDDLAHELSALHPFSVQDLEGEGPDGLRDGVVEHLHRALARQKERLGPRFPLIVRYLVLSTIDEAWLTHLYTLDDLREGIGWTAYGGTDPLIAFKRESFTLFQEMLARAASKIVRSLLSPRLAAPAESPQAAPAREVQYVHTSGGSTTSTAPKPKRKPVVGAKKPGRNEPCPCGSGKKFKNCCGRNA